MALLIVARVLNIHIVVLCKDSYCPLDWINHMRTVRVKLAFMGGHSFKELTSKVVEDFDQSLRKIYRELGSVKKVTATITSGCNCGGTCTCSDPSDASDNPSDDNASNGKEKGIYHYSFIRLMQWIFLLFKMPMVKKEAIDDSTQQSTDPPDAASTLHRVQQQMSSPFQTKHIERTDPYVCHLCFK